MLYFLLLIFILYEMELQVPIPISSISPFDSLRPRYSLLYFSSESIFRGIFSDHFYNSRCKERYRRYNAINHIFYYAALTTISNYIK